MYPEERRTAFPELAERDYRYCPVLDTVSMDRPGWVPCLEEMSVRMKTIRSPFFPEIFA
jgi:hypothetical protein